MIENNEGTSEIWKAGKNKPQPPSGCFEILLEQLSDSNTFYLKVCQNSTVSSKDS